MLGSESSELGVVVGLQFYAVLLYLSASPPSRSTRPSLYTHGTIFGHMPNKERGKLEEW